MLSSPSAAQNLQHRNMSASVDRCANQFVQWGLSDMIWNLRLSTSNTGLVHPHGPVSVPRDEIITLYPHALDLRFSV